VLGKHEDLDDKSVDLAITSVILSRRFALSRCAQPQKLVNLSASSCRQRD
jgi:hypothetical protein